MKKFILALLLASLFASAAFAGGATVTTGAGYMKMAQELCAAYKAETGKTVQEMYGGNIGQMLAQIEAGSGANMRNAAAHAPAIPAFTGRGRSRRRLIPKGRSCSGRELTVI